MFLPVHSVFPLDYPDRYNFTGHKLGVLPFLAILIADLLIITFYPPLTMWMAKQVAG